MHSVTIILLHTLVFNMYVYNTYIHTLCQSMSLKGELSQTMLKLCQRILLDIEDKYSRSVV